MPHQTDAREILKGDFFDKIKKMYLKKPSSFHLNF